MVLIDKVYRPSTLQAAWQRVKANRGAAGVDRVSVSRFEAHAGEYLSELAEHLREGKYKASAVRRVEIEKGGGKKRPLGIPTVKDRIVQMAVKMTLEPIFEAQFLPSSFGFRPGRGAKDALREVDRYLKEGRVHVVDADLQSYFDTIPHDRLMARVEDSVSDGRILSLLEQWLQQEIMTETASWKPLEGTPQGAVISPLLANLYLHSLDVHLDSLGYAMVRYADDFVVMCTNESEAQQALVEVKKWVAANGLSLNDDKTHIGDCRQPGQGFEFLGYRFECGRRDVRKKSLDRVKDRIREITPRRTGGNSIQDTITRLNPILRGWYGYFKHAQSTTFRILDRMIRRRLRAMLLNYQGKRGRGKTRAAHRKWPNAFFTDLGLVSLDTAHKTDCQSR